MFKAGAIIGEAILETAKWTSGIGVIQKTSKKALSALGGLAKLGLGAVTAGMTAAVYQANEYQKEFSNVSTLTNQNTKALQEMSLGLLRLDSELGSTRELTRSMYDAISAGAKPGKQAFDVITGAAKFAKAGVTDNAASVKLLSATVNAYGKDAKTMSGAQLTAAAAADIFFTTIKDGVITGEELSSTIGQSIPLYASMKIPVEQLAAGMAAMTKQGVNAAESTTQLNAIVNAFLKPSEALTEVLKEQGYESGQAFIQAEGLSGALDLLQGATEGGRYEIADLTTNIRAMKGVLALSGEGANIFKETLVDMKNASGAVDIAFKKQEKTFATMKNEMAKSAIIFGNIGKHFVDDIAGGAQTALEAMNEFIVSGKAVEKLLPVVRGIAGAFGLIKEFATSVYKLFEENLKETIADITNEFNDMFDEVSNTGTIFNALATVTDTLGAALNVVLKIVKMVIIAYIDLGTIAIRLIKTLGLLWETLIGKKQLKDVKAQLKEVGEGFKDLGTSIIENGKDIGKEAQKQWAELTDNTRTEADNFAKAWTESSEKAASVLKKKYTSMISGVKDGNQEIVNDAEVVGEKIVEKTEEVTEKSKTAWDQWKDYITANLQTVAQKVEFWMGIVLENMKYAFDGISQTTSMFYQNEQAKLDLDNLQKTEKRNIQYENDQAALDAQLAKGILTEAQYNEKSTALKTTYENEINAIEKEANKKKNDLALKQFKANKAFAIADIWMSLGQAIMGFWAAYGKIPFVGPIIAGIMTTVATGIAFAQTGLVSRQKFVPQYAEGTEFHPGGSAIVGEQGPELVNLPKGSKVMTNTETKNILKDSFGENKGINVHINNPIVREENDINKIVNAVSNALGRKLRLGTI